MEFTPEEWAARFQERITEVVKGDVMFTSVSTLLGEMSERIFEKGLDSSGGKHQYNSTEEIWVSDRTSPKGKQNTGKTGRAEKTSYFTSYKAYRSQIGRESSFVNWRLNNELNLDFSTKVFNLGDNEAGTGVSKQINAEKIRGLEKKYGAIFQPSQQEKNRLQQIVSDEINLILTK